MREFSLHFYTNTPCNVFVNGEMIGFIDNKDNFFIDIVSFSEQLIISCEPICEDNILYLPCSFRLNYVGNNLICSCNNIEIVPFPNHNFDIILDCKLMMVNSKSTLLSKKIDGYTILTMVDTISTLSIFLDDKNLYGNKSLMSKMPDILSDVYYDEQAELVNTILDDDKLLNNEKYFELKDARHPLIDQDKVVPLDINLGVKFQTIIITGPNTGGKTVTMKMTGLFSLMAMSGFYVPAEEESKIPFE